MCKMGCGCTKKSKFALPQMNGGGKTDPPGEGKAAKKKRARIIANSMYPEFKKEYERTKEQYAKHYPGGVEFVPAYGEQQLGESFSKVSPDEDVILMDHFSKERMFGVPVTPGTEGKSSLTGLFQNLQQQGYQGNCYLGVCHGEINARDIQSEGVDIPFFAADDSRQWAGGNTASQGSFEDFFFGLKTKEMFAPGSGIPNSTAIAPKMGEDYEMLLSERHQELMNRRATGSVPTALPTPNIKRDLLTKDKSIALAANQF